MLITIYSLFKNYLYYTYIMNEGYLYCLSNPAFDENTYKIGYTKNDPNLRMSQLNTTGVIYPFKLEFAKYVYNYAEKEKTLHLILDKYRINPNREFFKLNINEIKLLFDLLDGTWYENKKQYKIPSKNIIKESNQPTKNIIKETKQIDLGKETFNNIKEFIKVLQVIPPIIPPIIPPMVPIAIPIYCNRCNNKYTKPSIIISCNHNNICKECVNNLKECPQCKMLYNK